MLQIQQIEKPFAVANGLVRIYNVAEIYSKKMYASNKFLGYNADIV